MLFKSIEEIKQFLALGAGTDFNRLKPHIQNAETAFLLPLLGPVLYSELQSFYDAPPDPPAANSIQFSTLLSIVQRTPLDLLVRISGFERNHFRWWV